MKIRDYKDFLHDILDAVKDIESFIDNLSYDEFISDRKTLKAVIWSVEVIGEATKNIPPKSRQNTMRCLGNGWLGCGTN